MDLLECEAVNGCLDEETEEKATTCRDAIMVSVRCSFYCLNSDLNSVLMSSDR